MLSRFGLFTSRLSSVVKPRSLITGLVHDASAQWRTFSPEERRFFSTALAKPDDFKRVFHDFYAASDSHLHTDACCLFELLALGSHAIPTVEKVASIAKAISDRVGTPAKKGVRVSREDVGLDDDVIIQVDVGGEGFTADPSRIAGFPLAINLNAKTTKGPDGKETIPNLILVESWMRNNKVTYPFADGFVDIFTMQAAPLTEENVMEMARCLRPGGCIRLWVNAYDFEKEIKELADLLHSEAIPAEGFEANTADEFHEIIIRDRRPASEDDLSDALALR